MPFNQGSIKSTFGQSSCARSGVNVKQLSVCIRDGEEFRYLLSNISFNVEVGSFTCIVGISGSGKSTLIKALTSIIAASEGEVVLAGHSVRTLKTEFPLSLGYLPQFGAFHSTLTVAESLRISAKLRLPRSVSEATRYRWVEYIAGFSQVSRFREQRCGTLSGGQMRRLALAEELIGDPTFLFLDELTSGLDSYADLQIMLWLREMAHELGKTVVLVTHATYHLEYCDSLVFLNAGRLVFHGPYQALLCSHKVTSMTELFGLYQQGEAPLLEFETSVEPAADDDLPLESQPLKSAHPPSGLHQFPALLSRQLKLFWRDLGQLWLHLALILSFPIVVAVFATDGLPQVGRLTLALETNVLRTLQEQLLYLRESFHAASLISGMAMFQVVLLTLMGANNGAREVAKEKDILQKELRAGLSVAAYIAVKFLQVLGLAAVQAFWMAWFVKTICGFPGGLASQFIILFATVLAMSVTCLAISAAAPSAERASLLAIYLVGFQLPLSGAALALPSWLSTICRPFIAAYWGWSGYLRTFTETRHYDVVKQSTNTEIAPFGLCLGVLAVHVLTGLGLACYFMRRRQLA